MKTITRTILGVVILCIASSLAAQDIHSQIAVQRAQDESDRQAIVAATLNLSDTESKAFWPMYKEYRAEMGKVGDRGWKLLIEFADKYQSMTDADATKMLDEVLSIEKQQIEIKTKWMKSMRKTISATTIARFFQIDNKIDTLLRLDAAANVPLVEAKK
jgi:hypothetical protein